MASKYSVSLFNSSGVPQIGKTVELWTGNGTGGSTKTGDFTDNGDGSYYISVTTSANYTVKVDAVIQAELQDLFVGTDDLVVHIGAGNPHSDSASDTDLTTLKGAGWTTETVKVNADDLDTHEGKGIDTAHTGVLLDSQIPSGIARDAEIDVKIGDIDFAPGTYIDQQPDLTDAVLKLDAELGKVNAQVGVVGKQYLLIYADAVATAAAEPTVVEYANNLNIFKYRIRTAFVKPAASAKIYCSYKYKSGASYSALFGGFKMVIGGNDSNEGGFDGTQTSYIDGQLLTKDILGIGNQGDVIELELMMQNTQWSNTEIKIKDVVVWMEW